MRINMRLSFGRIVGRKVKMRETGEIGKCEFYDKIEHVFLISLESKKNSYNPDGILYCERGDFDII